MDILKRPKSQVYTTSIQTFSYGIPPPRGFLGLIYNDANLSVQSVISLVFFISPEGSPSRQGISETEFMERIRERMAQEVGGYVSTHTFALFYVYTGEREVTGFLKTY